MTAIVATAKPTFNVPLSGIKSVNYLDTTDWNAVTGIDPFTDAFQTFVAILKLSGPNGVFYINSGYNANNFDSPDINRMLVPIKAGIEGVPSDANGNLLNGLYSMYVKYRMGFGTITSATPGTKTFVTNYDGEAAGNIINNLITTPGASFKVVGGANAGTYTIASVSIVSTFLSIVVNETIPSNTAGGVFYGFTGEQVNSYNVCANVPKPKVQMTSNCLTSTLVCSDVTDYGSTPIAFISRENRVKYPLTMETAVPDIVNTDFQVNQSITVSPIYTKTWAGIITTSFTMNYGTYDVYAIIKGYAEHDVNCDIRLCGAFDCLKQLVDQWKAYLGVNPTAAKALETKIDKLYASFMLYSIAVECGNDEEACKQVDEIVDILGSTGCNCGCTDSEDEGVSQLVTPFGSATAGSIPFTYLEINNITSTTSNEKIPTTKAVVTYINTLLGNYYTESEIDTLLSTNFYTKTESDNRFPLKYQDNEATAGEVNDAAAVLNQKSGFAVFTHNVPTAPGTTVYLKISNSLVIARSLAIVQINTQTGLYAIKDIQCNTNEIQINVTNISAVPIDSDVTVQFIVL